MTLLDKSEKYLHQLKRMFKVLASSSIVRHQAPDIYRSAQQLLGTLATANGNSNVLKLAIDPNWRVELEEDKVCGVPGRTELHFGAEIYFKERCLQSQALSVVILFRADRDSQAVAGRPNLVAGENHVVRRFHFDFDSGVAGRDRPIAHLQYGGALTPSYLSLQDSENFRYELFKKLDRPRIPWTITDPSIVFDTFIRQFSSKLDEFVGGSDWRKCVMDSERLWLRDYFRGAAAMMDSSSNRVTLYDYCCDEDSFEH